MFSDIYQYVALEELNKNPYVKRLENYLQNHVKTATKMHNDLHNRASKIINQKDPKPAFMLTNKKSKKALLPHEHLLQGVKESEAITDFIKTLFNKPISTKYTDLTAYTKSIKSFVKPLKTFTLHGKNNEGYFIFYPKFKEDNKLLQPEETQYKVLGYDADYIKKLEEIEQLSDKVYKKLIGYQKDFIAYDKKYQKAIEQKNMTKEIKAIMRHHHYMTYQVYRAFLERGWYVFLDYMLDVTETIQQ